MADNTLNGVNLTVIAQEALPVLQARLAPLGLFTTDFSSEVATLGSAVSTRYASAMTADDYHRTSGYGISGSTSNVVTVTLNKHKHFTMGFDDSEIGNASLPVLQRTFIQPAINAICNAVQSDVIALMTAVFPSVYSGSYAQFGFSDLLSGSKVLDNSGSNTPRGALLGVNTYYSLLDDIKNVYSAGSDALRRGDVGVLGNVSVAMVPDTKFGGLSSTQAAGLAGFIAGKDSICIAARLPGIPSNPGIQVATVTDPNSGFSVQLRQWYSADDGMWKISAIGIYGVSRGQPGSGVRLITAD